METYKVIFPDGFDDYAWEFEIKGYYSEVRVNIGGQEYEIEFFDPTRLAQDIDMGLSYRAAVVVCNTVLVNAVTRDAMEQAVEYIVRSGEWRQLRPRTPDVA